MKKLYLFLGALLAAYVAYSYNTAGELPYVDRIKSYVENGEILTLEARVTPEQVIEQNKKELWGKEGKSYQEPILKFAPYLLLDVKYLDNNKSREGLLLWSLVDGEMVLNSDTWDKTHGFHDAMEVGATRQDFRLMNAIASNGNSLTKEKLQRELQIEADALDTLIEGARKKHLVIVKGSEVKLHFQNPNFLVSPETKMKQGIVTKPYSRDASLQKNFTKGQINKITQAAFGDDFKIRSSKEVFLPIYQIQVQNQDGTMMTTFWNALTGKRVFPN